MRFITFQPKDWMSEQERKGRGKDWHDLYFDQLKENPIWSIPAETIQQAFINTRMIMPSTPEKAIFFKTNNFHMIPKIKYLQWLNNKDDSLETTVPLLSSYRLKQYLKDQQNGTTIKQELIEKFPYEFEYLILPQDMNIIAEIDIDTCINTHCSDLQSQINTYIAQTEQIAKEKFKHTERSNWDTEERQIRNAISNLKWLWYFQDNDFFINDYKKIFGLSKNDVEISTNAIDQQYLDNLIDVFNINPNQENSDKVIEYLQNVLIKK